MLCDLDVFDSYYSDQEVLVSHPRQKQLEIVQYLERLYNGDVID